MSVLPNDYQKVEIFVDGAWVKATFVAAGYLPIQDEDGSADEVWWMDYYRLEDGESIPQDTHTDVELPPWRPLPKE